ncbi:NUDIX domain-containing protein [Candidatus Nomurabacteria bacterium]|nr:NUDIX domain-containing protein [Candidatus Nomurabacteria bacterium]
MSTVDLQRIATKALIINDDGQYLLLREASTYTEGTNIGKYSIPGGRLEIGEQVEDGLYREVKEETGLNVEIIKPIFVREWRPVIKGIRNQIVGIYFLCKAESTQVILSDEHDHYLWLDPSNSVDIDILESEVRMLQEYFKNHL